MRGFTQANMTHDKVGLEVDEDDPFLQADLVLTKRIGDKLYRHYPAHPWAISVSHAQGIATITLPPFAGRHALWKYVIKLYDLKSDPGLTSVVRAGGEMLERLNLPRTGFSGSQFADAINSAPIHKRLNNGLFQI
jgi:hypothetical protein